MSHYVYGSHNLWRSNWTPHLPQPQQHLLHSRRQAIEANDKGQRTVAASIYTPSKQQPAYHGSHEHGVASDGAKLNNPYT